MSDSRSPFASLEPRSAALPRRVNIDPDKVSKGLAELVLSVIELVRQLVERQALRRIEAGSLSDVEVERLGRTLMELERQMDELKRHFNIESLDIDLGPLGRLVDR